jgi:site-specific DNA-methyltransferase (adenine-specific)
VTPYWTSADGRAVVYVAEALAVLRELPAESVDAVFADPPYSSGGAFRADRAATGTVGKYLSTEAGADRWPDIAGDSRDQRSYSYWCALWLSECLRITRSGGVGMVWTDWRQLPTTSDSLQAGGWVWRGVVPWAKPDARPRPGRFRNSCEYVVWGSAGSMPITDAAPLPGFYDATAPRHRVHPTQKPLSVIRGMVRIVPPGGVILDPFCGSGTTGVAALLEGRRFIGIESIAEYADIATRRLGETRSDDPSVPSLFDGGGA